MTTLVYKRAQGPFVWLMVAALLCSTLLVQPGLRAPELALGLGQAATPTPDSAGLNDPAPRLAFDTLQRRTPRTLAVHWRPLTGTPDFLAGADLDGATRIPYTPTAAERGNPLAVARGFLDENRALFRLTSATDELEPLPVEPDYQRDFTNVRFRQVYRGLPVYGRQLIVHLDPQEQIVAVNGHFVPGIAVPTQPTLGQASAESLAVEDLRDTQLDAAERASVQAVVLREKTRLVVYVDSNNKATLAWQVTVMTQAPLGQWRYFVNARRPTIVHRSDTIADGKVRRTFSAQNTTSIPGRVVIEEGERSRDAVAQAAHDGAGRVYDYYFTKFQRDSIDGRGSPLVSTVHYGSDPAESENAAWIGEAAQMVYGDGGRVFKPLPYGLDVVGHEFTHGVIESTANLVYEGQSGALNESYADIFGTLIAGSNWTIGGAVVKSPPYPLPYLRSLADPNANGSYDPRNPLRGVGQPAHMREYASLPVSRRADNGGVHINSGIPNHAAFLIAQALGNEKLEQIVYRALTQYLTPDADFLTAARVSVRAASDLYGPAEAEAVRNAFAQVGLDAGGGATPPPAQPAPTPPPLPKPGPGTPDQPPLPQGCTNIIANGGFESEVGWTQRSTSQTAIIDPELPRTGARSAWLGGTDKETLQYIFQDVTIPANATSARLSYFRLIHQETSGLIGGLFTSEARLAVIVADTSGNVLNPVEVVSSKQGDDQWKEAGADLSRFAGKTIRLAFRAENPRGNISSFFVDDVALAICTAGAAPSAPSPGSPDRVYIQGKVTSADTGRGIAGAQLIILRPGVSASQAAADNAISASEVLTKAVTDGQGIYRSDEPVPRGQTYSVIIIAGGYRSVVADNAMNVPASAGNPHTVNATMRRGR